jgi:hypothetical protein
MKAFEALNQGTTTGDHPWANSLAVGVAVQYLCGPLFKLNLANHNYRFGDSEGLRAFFGNIRQQSTEGPIQYLFKVPASLLARGGVVGLIQLGMFKEAVEWVEGPKHTGAAKAGGPKNKNEKAREFIESVQDNNELLFRLAASGYFDQKTDFSGLEGVSSYRSILIASAFTSTVLSAVLTPLDIVVFNQAQTRLYTPSKSQALRSITFRQVARDLLKVSGLSRILTMAFAGSLIRNFFVMTTMFCVDNYQRGLAFESE